MPGPDIGDLYLDVHADTKGLAGEIRRAGKLAGKDFGSAFSGEASKGFGGLSADMVKQFNAGTLGQQSGKDFVDSFQKRAVKDMRGWNLDLDLDLQDAIRDADWGPVLDNFDSLQEAMDATEERLRVLSRGSSKQRSVLSQLGTSYGDVRASLDAYVQGMSDEAEASDRAEKALLRQKLAMQEMAKEITTGITASENLAKATEKQNRAFRDRSMQDWADQIKNGITASENLRKEQEELAKSGRLKESILAMNDYGDAATDTRAAFRDLSAELKKLQKADVGGRLGQQIRELAEEFDDLEGSFATMQRSQRDALVGMEKDQDGYARRVRESSEEVRGLSERLAGLAGRSSRLTTVVDLDTPSKGDAEKEGRGLGAAFSDAFRKALGRDKGRSGVFDSLKSEWNQFLYAFPAEVTLLLRYFGLISTELGALGSGVGGILTAAIGALGNAIVGLGAAFASLGPAAAYGIGLATAAVGQFEKSFPPTYQAIERLKAAFTEVDVPAFAREWEGSVRSFANTLAASLEGDTIAANLGQAAAGVTNAFTAVLQSPGWTGFVTAMETRIPDALQAIGTGFAQAFSALLPFLTAAAPLAESLGTQFLEWATSLSEFTNSAVGLATMRDLFAEMSQSISVVTSLISNLGGALTGTLGAGVPAGQRMLGTLAALAEQWNTWTKSVEGQTALSVWFNQSETIFNALLPLLGAVGKMFADLVTPETVAQTVNFLNQLTALMAPLGDILAVLSELDVLGSLATLANSVLSAFQPLIPALTSIASTVGSVFGQIAQQVGPVLTSALTALRPAFEALATQIGPILSSLMPIVESLSGVFLQVAGTIGAALVPVINALAPTISAIAPVFAQLASTIGMVFAGAIGSLLPVIVQLLPVIANLASTLASALMPIVLALGPVFAQLAPVIAQVAIMLAETLAPIIAQLGPLIAQLAPVVTALVQALVPIIGVVLQVVAQLAGALMPIIQALLPIFVQLAPAIIQLFIAFNPVLRIITLLLPVLMPLINLISQLVVWILNLIAPLAPLINQILMVVAQFLGFNKAISAVMGFIGRLIPIIGKVITWFGNFFTGIGNGAKLIGQFVSKVWSLFSSLFSRLASLVSKFVSGFIGFLQRMVTTVSSSIAQFVVNTVRFFVELWAKVGSAVSKGISNVVGFFRGLWDKIWGAISSIGSSLSNAFGGFLGKALEGVRSGWTAVQNFFQDIPSKIVNTLAGAGTLLYQTGRDVVQGLLDGVGSLAGTIGNWFLDKLPGWIRTPFKKALGIASPSKVFKEFGKNLIEGLALGLLENRDEVTKAVKSVAEDVADLQDDLIREEADRIIEARKKANDRIRAANQSNGKDAKDRNYLPTISRTEATKIATQNTKAIRKVARDAYAELIAGQNRITKGVSTNEILNAAKKSQYSLNQFVKTEGVTLASLAQARKVMADRIEAQNDRLQDAIKVRDDFAAQVRDAALAYASALSAAGKIQLGEGEVLTSDAVTDQMKKQLADLKTFRANIETLTARGLNQTTLQQIVEAGVEGGSALAQALVTGGKEAVADTNSLQSQITTAAKGLGTDTSKTFYQAGVDSAKGLLEGLQSQNQKIKGAINKLAERIIKQFKKELGIKSPSRVLAKEIGNPMAMGIVQGLRAGAPDISNTLRDISSGQVLVANRNAAASAVTTQGRVVNVAEGAIQVTAVVADPEMVANSVLDRLAARMQ